MFDTREIESFQGKIEENLYLTENGAAIYQMHESLLRLCNSKKDSIFRGILFLRILQSPRIYSEND